MQLRNVRCTKDSSMQGGVLVSRMLLSFVTNLQDDTKDSSMRCDVLVFWDATIFCNNFMPDAAGAATAKRRFSKTEKHFGPSF